MMLIEISQTQKTTYYMIPFAENSRRCKLLDSDKRQVMVTWDRARARRDRGRDDKGM